MVVKALDSLIYGIVNDVINLTPGQLIVKYWWLWLLVMISAGISERGRR
ncbi:MAG: hypothetical protein GX375_08555 [Clostridiales bacterium]|nr:hypothetical protein [Clostridiales bacterium]